MERATSTSTKIPLTPLQCNTTGGSNNNIPAPKRSSSPSNGTSQFTAVSRFNNLPTQLTQLKNSMTTKVQAANHPGCGINPLGRVAAEKMMIEAKLKNLTDELSKIEFKSKKVESSTMPEKQTTLQLENCCEVVNSHKETTQDENDPAPKKQPNISSTTTTRTVVSHFHNRNHPIKSHSLDMGMDEENAQCDGSSSYGGSSPNGQEINCDSTSLDPNCDTAEGASIKGMISKIRSLDSMRPIYPNVPYSPYSSPFQSPRTGRRRPPLRESRRISIEQSGSFLQLNQYKLLDQIGQGSYGLVKLAYSEEDSTHYAMKILSKRKLLRKAGLMGRGPKKGTSPLDRVYREIAVLKKLDHPNVVKLIEVLDDPIDDKLYLAFELVQQGEVLSIPTTSPLTEERCWCVFRDVVLGLEYLHYQRIIHGDLKPGNLLLGEFGRVKIADLGVCNEFFGEDASINNGSTAGTPAFRAPETLLVGDHSYSGKAVDIYALGATLYALVYGNVPFDAPSVMSVYEKIKTEEVKFPVTPVYSPELKELILRMLEKDPPKRISLPEIKVNKWVTADDTFPLPSEEENCRLVQISDEDMTTVVKSIPKLDTLILIKTMLKKHSFQNPFPKAISGRAPQRGGSRLERFSRSGRSNSAPGAYSTYESMRQFSTENCLPSLIEGVTTCSELSTEKEEHLEDETTR